VVLDPIVTGSLDAVTLASVLQLVESEALDAEVAVATGALRFRDGQLVEASFLGLEGDAAVVEAAVRARGRFAVLPVSPSGLPSTPLSPSGALIIESFRIADEMVRFGGQVVDEGLTIGPVTGDGRRTLSQLIAAQEAHAVRVVPAALELDAAGRRLGAPSELDPLAPLRVSDTPAAPGSDSRITHEPDAPQRSFDELCFAARRKVRERRFDEARDLLHEAGRLRPEDRMVRQNLKRLEDLEARIHQHLET
jgi:hypothetical protein